MIIAIVGSRNITVNNIKDYITDVDEIVSGGANGVDHCAAEYARMSGLKLTEFLPEYDLYGCAVPIIRNRKIVAYADKVLVFWDGVSKGSLSVIKYAEEVGKDCRVVICK